ncbi:MAG: type VI secretion system contractile sheath large subunit [Pirellulales bacterium]
MAYEMSFGNLRVASGGAAKPSGKFRIAVLGDFSAAANAGRVQTGAELAVRKPQRVDVDNLDDVLKRFKVAMHLPIAADDGSVELKIGEMDDFHPDQLHDELELFSEFSGLRQRLKNRATFAAAAKEVQGWAGDETDASYTAPRRSGGATLPVGKLTDFARLVGAKGPAEREATAADELIKQIVGPHVVAAKDPQQDKLVAAVDAALSDAMRRVLHHPDFQTVESLWRSVDLLVRNLETGSQLEIVLFDLTAEELAADLSGTDALEETGLYKLLVEQPSLDAQQGAFSVIVGGYTFEKTPPQAELLGRVAKIAYAVRAPFIAAISNDVLTKRKPEDVHPLIKESWDALRALPEAAYLGLVTPRFLLRHPYGKKSEPIEPFDFEEFTKQEGFRGMLWGNGAFVAALLLGLTFQKQGLKSMKLGSVMSVGDIPYYYYTDDEGDQVALPCTDRLVNEATVALATSQGFQPIVSLKGRDEVRLGSFNSLAGKPLLGPWSTEQITPSAASSTGTASAPAAVEPVAAAATPAPAPTPEPAPAAEPAAPAASLDSELDALLASLGGSDAPAGDGAAAASSDSSGGIDPELAALLADL